MSQIFNLGLQKKVLSFFEHFQHSVRKIENAIRLDKIACLRSVQGGNHKEIVASYFG